MLSKYTPDGVHQWQTYRIPAQLVDDKKMLVHLMCSRGLPWKALDDYQACEIETHVEFLLFCCCVSHLCPMGLNVLGFLSHLLLQRFHHAFRLRSRRILPSISGSRFTIFYCYASSALLQLVNQWLNFTYYHVLSRFPLQRRKKTISVFHKN